MLSAVPWHEIGLIMVKTTVIYWSMLFGLKLVGRRAIGQMGPHEFILIALLAKIMGDQIIPEHLGLWGNIAGGITLFFHVGLIDRMPMIRDFIQGDPIRLMKNGRPDLHVLQRCNFTEDDLNRVARDYGFSSYNAFDSIVLERDGRLSGILKPIPNSSDFIVKRSEKSKQL